MSMWTVDLPDGRYKYVKDYKDPYTNKKRYVSTILSKNSRQAENEASRILTQKIETKLNNLSKINITFGQLVEEWKEVHSTNVKPRTMRVYKRPLEIILDFIDANVIIDNIDSRLLQRFFNSLEGYSPNTIKLIKQPLNLIMEYAVRMDYITVNPLKKVIVKRAKNSRKQELDAKYLESDQIKILLQEMRNGKESSHFANFAELIFLTGVRPGEALAIKWSEIDFESKELKIIGTLDYTFNGHAKAIVTSPKTENAYRIISLPNRVIDIFAEELNYQKINEFNTEFVFISKTGNHMSINSVNHRIKSASRKVFGKEITAHSLRHAHITLLTEMGVPIKAIMDRVGHKDVNTTLKIYTHTTQKASKDIAKNLNKLE